MGAVMLDGRDYSEHLIIEGLEGTDLVAVGVEHTIGGEAVVMSDEIDQEVGVYLSLVGERHFSLEDIQHARTLKGRTVELVHHRGTFNVKVIRTPAEQDDIGPVADPTSDMWYSGAIEMITV